MTFIDVIELVLWTALAATVWASLFEWALHRYFMHRPLAGIDYAFKAHAQVHHKHFKADETYHLIEANREHKKTIPMAWWNGIVLILSNGALAFIVSLFIGHCIIVPLTVMCVATIYYGVYERIHWCMHLPKQRRLEKSRIFFMLNGHHLLHHRYMHKNFNVVLPLFDLLLGTLLLRSKLTFKQAEGPSVPNVQPRKQRFPKLAVPH